jgi:hypothetical protein
VTAETVHYRVRPTSKRVVLSEDTATAWIAGDPDTCETLLRQAHYVARVQRIDVLLVDPAGTVLCRVRARRRRETTPLWRTAP